MSANPSQLIEDLTDALLASGVEPTRELLDAILWAVGANGITEQQFAVLRAAIGGASDKQIADSLGIHINTVQLHWREIRRRIGIESKLRLGAHIVSATLCKHTGCQSPAASVVSQSKGKSARK